MAASQVLHGFWREVVYLWRTCKLPRDFFEVSQIWLYRGGTASVSCLRASSVGAMAMHGPAMNIVQALPVSCRQYVQASL